ncbi:MAG: cardiolipin synthase [Gammaproteobacteria bacterium HGW-Gammaproteobacteria-6]|nr:MAG: cardiolipin synthase [Gammaproteobacteria bacterium HGW-Gammaproteobacteria-6]
MDNLQNIIGLILAILYWLLTAAVTLRVVTQRRPVSVTLAWLLVIYILPLLGVILYLLIGELNLGRTRAARAQAMVEPYLDNLNLRFGSNHIPHPGGQIAYAVHQLLATRVGIGALGYSRMEILDSPSQIFERMLDDIRNAQQSIRIESYIWHPRGRINQVSEELIAASQRGVRVSLLIDHAGSRRFFRSAWRKRMVAAGIEVVPALPVRLMRALIHRIDLRLHRKLLIVDDQIAYTGSMNMADPLYFKKGSRSGQWVDVMLRLDGQAAAGLAKVFSWDWEVETGQRHLPELYSAPEACDKWLSVIPSGPGVGEDLIGQAVLSSIYRANHSITISTPYFVPSEAIFDALCQAAKRGVCVRILLPRRNDSLMVRWASRSYYQLLLEAGVQILQFDGGLLHVKAMLMDEELALVGSVNLDIRSLQLNFELTVALFDKSGCLRISALLERYAAQCEPLELERWQQRSKLSRVIERMMFFMSPLL